MVGVGGNIMICGWFDVWNLIMLKGEFISLNLEEFSINMGILW